MKKGHLIITGIFILWIYGLLLAFLLLPDGHFSGMENRNLAQAPKFTLSDVASGEFMEDFETYVNDQFAGRNFFVQMNAAASYLGGQRELNGVYLCSDNTLIREFTAGLDGYLTQNAENIGKYAKTSDIPVYFAVVPGAAEIWSDKLPDGAPNPDQKSVIEELYAISGVDCADVYSALEAQSDEYIYYHTDHHWTSLGAYYGYTAIMDTLGLTPTPLSDYEDTTVCTDFFGTLYSKAPLWWQKPDEIHTYVPEDGITVKAFTGSQTVDSELYCEENLDIKDKYTFFLGENQPIVTITTKNTDAPKILILRDSYANSLVPFLTANFSEIHLIDARYYKQPISEYIEANGIDIVLVCYSLQNLSEDGYLGLIMR